MLLGTLFPDSIHSIIACVPSSVVYASPTDPTKDTWLFHGKPLIPFAPIDAGETRAQFIEGMRDAASFEKARIPVEKIICPVLIISGGDDQMWPSDIFAEQIVDCSPHFQHLNYPKAGHGITFPYLPEPEPVYFHPIAKKSFTLGGTRSANAQANADFWAHLLEFLKQ